MKDILDRLVEGVIDGPGDLMGIGECLNLLETLEDDADFQGGRAPILNQLKLRFKRIVLEESSSLDDDWREIRKLISSLESDGNDDLFPGPVSRPPEVDWPNIQKLIEDVCEKPGEESVLPPSDGDDGQEEEWSLDDLASVDDQVAQDEIQDPELLKDFIEEAKEHLSSIELNLLSLEADPHDQEAINAVFRPFHSIKGVAGFLNLKDIHHISHEVENMLDAARSGTLVINDAMIDIVLNAVDILKMLLGNLESIKREGGTVPMQPSLVEPFLDRVKNFNGEDVSGTGVPIRKVGQILVEQGVLDSGTVDDVAERSRSTGRKIGEVLIQEGTVSTRDVTMALREQRRTKENAASVRIDTVKLDNLVDMVGELVIAQTMVLQNPEVLAVKDQKLQKDSVQLSRITAELQRISMSMRMVPIKATFQKMIRLVRDLSKKSGKEVALVMKGEDTEIDRNMVEEIYDPLVHMIRNSVDHGIELPEERSRAGKDPTGTIHLAAEQKGGNIVIDIRDDGKGLDVTRIRKKAIERGIISPDDQLDEKAVYELIMAPGFSTKDQVTDVSGRGVGMDVVKKSVEQLRGKMDISSSYGKGTHFQLKLPLTMAIIDGMVIQIGLDRYVVPTIALKESLRPAENAYLTVQGKGEMIKVRNTLMPLVRLHELFGVEPRIRNPWEGLLLVVSEGAHSYCLLADEIVGRQEVVIKSLGGSLRHLVGISGGAILGDGRVALIIDVKGVVNLYEENAR